MLYTTFFTAEHTEDHKIDLPLLGELGQTSRDLLCICSESSESRVVCPNSSKSGFCRFFGMLYTTLSYSETHRTFLKEITFSQKPLPHPAIRSHFNTAGCQASPIRGRPPPPATYDGRRGCEAGARRAAEHVDGCGSRQIQRVRPVVDLPQSRWWWDALE